MNYERFISKTEKNVDLVFNEQPEFLTAKDISEILGIGHLSAYELMDRPGFPLIRIGRLKKVNKAKFFIWLDENTTNVTK